MTEAEDLHETLAALHEELEAADDLNEESRALLRGALVEIRAKLDETDPGIPTEPPDWVERLRESARHFEDSHPDLVRAVGRVARALSNVGF